MRRPRIQFTVRRLMLLVAVVALVIWCDRMRRLSASYRVEAERYAIRERVWATSLEWELEQERTARQGGFISRMFYFRETLGRRNAAEYRKQIERCARQRLRFERAARSPWLPLASDSPDPE